MQFGLKLGSRNTGYTKDIISLYDAGYFQYIELFAVLESYDETIEYWKQFSIPIIIHAPHSFAGMNLSLPEERENNKKKLRETFHFADALKSEFIIFHSGVNGAIEETITQLRPFIDSRCLIENKPAIGLNGEKCLGSTPNEIELILNELRIGFCLDFGHAICSANTMKKDALDFINEFMALNPSMYHLSDGEYTSELDSHAHYGKGTFPLKELLKMLPQGAKVSDEARNDADLHDFASDCLFFMSNLYLRKVSYSDMDLLYEWANDSDTRLNSFSSAAIPYEVHTQWFKDKLDSDSVLLLIYHHGDENIGQVRIELSADTARLSCSISPSHRSKGYGYKMLLLAEEKVKREYGTVNCLLGEVKNENIPSLQMMRRLNYSEEQEPGFVRFTKKISRDNE